MKLKNIISIIGCFIFLTFVTACASNDVKEVDKKEDTKTTKVEKKESGYLSKISDSFDVKKFDSKKFNGLVYKGDQEIDIKTIINENYKENNFYLQYYMDGLSQEDKDQTNKQQSVDVLDSKTYYYYNILGEPSSICGIYYDWGSYDGPTGLVEFVWQYDDYSIRVSTADYSNWSEKRSVVTKFLGVTAYLNENSENEVAKSIGYWDKDGKVKEKKCVGIDLLSKK